MKAEIITSNKPQRKGEFFIIDRDRQLFLIKIYKDVPEKEQLTHKIIDLLNKS